MVETSRLEARHLEQALRWQEFVVLAVVLAVVFGERRPG